MANPPNPYYAPNYLELSYANCNQLCDFLDNYRGTNNDNSGKYNVPLRVVQNLFNTTWRNIPTGNGHIKLEHNVTHVVINYKNHDNDPVDPGAVNTLAESLQNHINIFYEKYLGYPTRLRHTLNPNFNEISASLNAQNK